MTEPAAAATEVDPLIALGHKIFTLKNVDLPEKERKALQTTILDTLFERNMAPVYEHLCPGVLGIPLDASRLQSMRDANAKRLEELQARLRDAEENQGETEVREALLARADFLASTGDMAGALQAYKETEAKTVALGQRMDMVFSTLRLCMFYGDWAGVRARIAEAKKLFEEGADWERKNRLKVYEALLLIVLRRFREASRLLLDAVATFTTTELMPYERCIFYCAATSLLALPRVELKAHVIDSPEVLTAIERLGALGPLVNALHACDYRAFFRSLADFSDDLRADPYLFPHFRFYLREVRALAYSQYLESYKAVRLDAFAAALGVSPDFLDRELADFIVAGRLHCKVDKVAGVVETTRPDAKNALYQQCIRQGDLLLNRIQKLSKVAEID